jgi:DNA-binding LacI/PurR family transcriptional regulator
MVGIKRLAEHLNVSIGTVSRALNGKPDVNEATRKRVFEAAEALGYVANQSGRSLRKGTTNAIGLMIESSPETAANSDNFFLGVIEGLQSTFSRHGLDLVVLPCASDDEPHLYIERIAARRMVDGMIISATRRHDQRIDFLSRAKIPFVALGRSATPGDYPWVDLDFEGVASRAIDRLVANGHRRIAIAVPSNDVNLGFIFLESYKASLLRHAMAFDPELVIRTHSTEQGGYLVGEQVLSMPQRPTAVLLIYELMAVGLYRRLSEANILAGRDIAVVGFRESPLSRFLSPTLTSFRLSLHDLGISLGEALLATMPAFADAYPIGITQKIWPMELVEGESDAVRIP